MDVTEAREFYLEQSKKYGYDQWDMDKKYGFESTTGKSFQLTLEQIMSLYAYSKRDQADDHLRMGGFVFDSAIEVVEKKHGIPVKYTVNTATAYNLSPEILYYFFFVTIPIVVAHTFSTISSCLLEDKR